MFSCIHVDLCWYKVWQVENMDQNKLHLVFKCWLPDVSVSGPAARTIGVKVLLPTQSCIFFYSVFSEFKKIVIQYSFSASHSTDSMYCKCHYVQTELWWSIKQWNYVIYISENQFMLISDMFGPLLCTCQMIKLCLKPTNALIYLEPPLCLPLQCLGEPDDCSLVAIMQSCMLCEATQSKRN